MLNLAVLQGRLTADPEIKTTQSGIAMVKFTIAIDRAYSQNKETDFIEIVSFSKTAEFINKYFTKGQMILIDGNIQTGSYTDKDGNKRKSFTIVARSVNFCGKKEDSENAVVRKNRTAEQISDEVNSDGFQDVIADDDLPF